MGWIDLPSARRLSRLARAVASPGRIREVVRCALETADWPALVAAYATLDEARVPRELEFRSGERLLLRTVHDLVTAWIVFFRREYRVDPSSRTILDAGANIGAFSLYAARRAPGARIVALEPFGDTYARLLDTLERNALSARVKARRVGLAGMSGTRRMDTSPGPSQSRGMLDEGTTGGEPFEARTLEDLLAEEGLGEVDLLKIDIEGGEHEVFAATSRATLRRFRAIAMEYHPNGSKDALVGRLEAGGFTVTRDEVAGPGSGVMHLVRQG